MLQLIHTCSISRNQSVGTNGRTALQQIGTAVRCLAIPMNAATAIKNGFDLDRAYDFFFDLTADVKVGDKLAFGGDTYVVSARQSYQMPLVGHIHILAAQEVN